MLCEFGAAVDILNAVRLVGFCALLAGPSSALGACVSDSHLRGRIVPTLHTSGRLCAAVVLMVVLRELRDPRTTAADVPSRHSAEPQMPPSHPTF